jgi:hypothetical protein
MKHENAHKRGRGEICAGGMGNGGLEGGMGGIPGLDKSLQGFPRGSLDHGCESLGSITADTKSDPWKTVPGRNNKDSTI